MINATWHNIFSGSNLGCEKQNNTDIYLAHTTKASQPNDKSYLAHHFFLLHFYSSVRVEFPLSLLGSATSNLGCEKQNNTNINSSVHAEFPLPLLGSGCEKQNNNHI